MVKLSILFTLFTRRKLNRMMKIGNWIIVLGSIITILGVIFHLQGQSIVGPESSFMYSNPEWITYGFQIAIVGIVMTIVGGILVKIKK